LSRNSREFICLAGGWTARSISPWSGLGNQLVALNFKPSAELKGWYATIKNTQPTISEVWAESHEKG
jgi:hypothetical protein